MTFSKVACLLLDLYHVIVVERVSIVAAYYYYCNRFFEFCYHFSIHQFLPIDCDFKSLRFRNEHLRVVDKIGMQFY